MKVFLYYFCVINLVAVFLYGLDKYKAKKDRWRIPEKVLIGIAMIGGSIGALVGMKMFHHKTKKMKFYLGVPVILILQAVLAVYIYVKFF